MSPNKDNTECNNVATLLAALVASPILVCTQLHMLRPVFVHIITGSCIKAAGASSLTLYYSVLNSIQKSPQLDSHSSPHLGSPLFSRSSRDRAGYLTFEMQLLS